MSEIKTVKQTIHYVNKKGNIVSPEKERKVSFVTVTRQDPNLKFTFEKSKLSTTGDDLGHNKNILTGLRDNAEVTDAYYALDAYTSKAVEIKEQPKLDDKGEPVSDGEIIWEKVKGASLVSGLEDVQLPEGYTRDKEKWLSSIRYYLEEVPHPEVAGYKVIEVTPGNVGNTGKVDLSILSMAGDNDIRVIYSKQTRALIVSNNDPEYDLQDENQQPSQGYYVNGYEDESIRFDQSQIKLDRIGYTYTVNGKSTLGEAVATTPKFGEKDTLFRVIYLPKEAKAKVEYIDIDNNDAVVGEKVITGKTADAFEITVDFPDKDNYDIVDWQPAKQESYFFDKADDTDVISQVIKVMLAHKHEIRQIETINRVIYKGIPNQQPKETVVTWTVDKDLVINLSTYKPNTDRTIIDSPVVADYYTDEESVTFENQTGVVQPNNQLKEVTYRVVKPLMELTPAQPIIPLTQLEPAQPIVPLTPLVSAQPTIPLTPLEPAPPIKTVTGEALMQAAKPEGFLPLTELTPAQPVIPLTQLEPAQPIIPLTPLEPATSVKTVKGEALMQATKPEGILPLTELTPAQPVIPLTSLEPAQPIIPLTQLEPATPVLPLTQLEPAQPIIPLTPLVSAQPIIPLTPLEPAQPIIPLTRLEPATPVKTFTGEPLMQDVKPEGFLSLTELTPAQPVIPLTSLEPAQPIIPLAQLEPAQPIIPLTPLESATSVKTVKGEALMQAAKPEGFLPLTELTPAQPVIPLTPLEPATPLKTLKGEPLMQDVKPEGFLPLTELTPAQPIIPLTQLTPATPVIPLTQLEPAMPLKTFKGEPLMQAAKPEGFLPLTELTPAQPIIPLTQLEPATPLKTLKGEPLMPAQPIIPLTQLTPATPVIPLTQLEPAMPLKTFKGEALIQAPKPDGILPETSKGEPLMQTLKPEGVLQEASQKSSAAMMVLNGMQSEKISLTSHGAVQKQSEVALPKTGEKGQLYLTILGELFVTLAIAGIGISVKHKKIDD